ncbi:hypothetical protein ILUMI_10867 [Ignelater luminosus]|uniref:Uncharacterized protein n=1 Tax=Ignelater luminosus TaxID=2038154 RepID=A0A8K0D351_IGNLU|nr:hypothetical protein ILUMI_10867 [Ignelater luminosus]
MFCLTIFLCVCLLGIKSFIRMMLKIIVVLSVYSLGQKTIFLDGSGLLRLKKYDQHKTDDIVCFMKFKNVNENLMSRIRFVLNKSRRDNDPAESEVIKKFVDIISILQGENPTSLIKIGVAYLDSIDNFRKNIPVNTIRIPVQICRLAKRNGPEHKLHKHSLYRQLNLPFVYNKPKNSTMKDNVGKKKFHVIY